MPAVLVSALHDGPFGPTHLRALAADLARTTSVPTPYAWPLALLRNLALYPVVLAHGITRQLPFSRR